MALICRGFSRAWQVIKWSIDKWLIHTYPGALRGNDVLLLRGRAAAQREQNMVSIPIRSRIPLEVWVAAGVFTILSAISSFLAGPEASVGLTLAHSVH